MAVKTKKAPAKKAAPAKKEAKAAAPAKAKPLDGARGKLPTPPPNMAWVSLYLCVKDPLRALDFYEKAFGFVKRMAMPGPDGKVMHAEMWYRDCTIMMGPEYPDMGFRAPSSIGTGNSAGFYVYCDNVDVLTEKARAAGATVKQEPKDQFYGDRTATFIDPDGHSWTFGHRVFEFDPKKHHPA
jgi:PhnB protein